MLKKILIILIVFLSVSAVYAEDNATDTMNQSIGDAELTTPEQTKTFDDIQRYIDNAGENSTIYLEGTYKTAGRAIKISKDITLEGINGKATLDGDLASRILNVNSCRVTLNNLNFINARSIDSGGAILTTGNLIIRNCNFSNNYVSEEYENGGAIFAEGDLTIINSTFTDNVAASEGGAISIRKDYSNHFITDCTFKNNSAYRLYGGAIDVYCDNTNASINNCTFLNNTAGDGGAISAEAYLLIKDCEFYNNVASRLATGGAIRGGGNVINCIFLNNSAINDGVGGAIYKTKNVVNCTFLNNHAATAGGAIYKAENVVNCTFLNNSAIGNDGYGGAISYSKSIINCNFTNNTAAREGGAIFITTVVYSDMLTYIDNYNVTVSNCSFANNRAGDEGGAIYSVSNMIIADSTFTNNTADYCGAIILYSGRNKIDNCTFKENSYGNILFTFFKRYYNRIQWPSPTHGYSELSINNTLYTKSVSLDNDLKPINLVKANVAKVNNIYYGDSLKIKITNIYTGNPVKDAKFIVKIGSKNYYLTTNSKGIAYFKTSMKTGTYKATVTTSEYNGYLAMAKTQTTIKVKKAPTTIKAPKVTAKYKKSKYFKVTVKHKSTKQVVKNIKVKIKVYTGKKSKTYTVKTGKKGVAQINTKSLKKGSHKVMISSGNSNYIISAKSTIKIK